MRTNREGLNRHVARRAPGQSHFDLAGAKRLNGRVAVAEAKVGEGKVFLMGPEVTFRGEPHVTFKFLFNGVLYGPAKPETLRKGD